MLRRLFARDAFADLRTVFPEAWGQGEEFANYQFRDLVYLGFDAPPNRSEAQELADVFVDEALQRFLSSGTMSNDPQARRVFAEAFRNRLTKLLGEYRRAPDDADEDNATYAVAGVMNPGSAAALITEARRARFEDDMTGGPLTARSLEASLASEHLVKLGISSGSDEEIARRHPATCASILQLKVFQGVLDVEEAVRLVPTAQDGLREAALQRERRLCGGPLTDS